jgi:cell shape-determining protein MreC
LVRQIVGDFTDKTQSREEKDQENANLFRQALSKLHESVKEKVNRSELKVLRETLEKTRNMEVTAVCNHSRYFH